MDHDRPIANLDFSKLTTVLFSAALGQSTWADFLEQLSHEADGVSTHIFGFDTESNVSFDILSYGYDPDFIESYNSYYGEINAWAKGFSEHNSGIVVDCEEMCKQDKLVRTEFYHDWLKPQDDIIQGGGALLFKNEARFFCLGGNIRLKDSEKLKARWLQIVDQIIPQAQQAFEISRALEGARLETALVADNQLSQIPGILLLSATGRILFANPYAQDMIAKGDPISCDTNGFLETSGRLSNNEPNSLFFQHWLSTPQPSLTLQSSRNLNGEQFQLRFVKLDERAEIPLPKGIPFGITEHCILLLIVPLKLPKFTLQSLETQFGLTNAELGLVQEIATGRTNRQIADARGRSIETINSQVKSILSKTFCANRTQFVSLVMRLYS